MKINLGLSNITGDMNFKQ